MPSCFILFMFHSGTAVANEPSETEQEIRKLLNSQCGALKHKIKLVDEEIYLCGQSKKKQRSQATCRHAAKS